MGLTRSIYLRPIKVAMAYSIATIILYEFGPYEYPSINKLELYFFLIFAHIMMYAGFKSGINKSCRQNLCDLPVFPIDKFLNFLFFISFISFIPRFVIFTGFYDGGISALVNGARLFFSSAQELYIAKQSLANVTGIWKYINYFDVLTSALYWAYLPLSVLFWRRIRGFRRFGTVLIWIFYFLQYITTGTNVGLFNGIVTISVIYVIKKFASGKYRGYSNKIRRLVVVCVAVVLLFSIFSTTMSSRIGDRYKTFESVGNYSCSYDENSILNRITPQVLHPTVAYFARYLGLPYNALAMSFSVPFRSTYGFGHSMFLLDNGPKGIEDRTYQMELERRFNYDHYSNWHTMYLWFANDVSIWLVPILLFFLFAYFGKSWRLFLETGNLFSFLTFMLFVNMMVFISANNQVFQDYHTMFAFWLFLFLNRIGKKYNWINVWSAI